MIYEILIMKFWSSIKNCCTDDIRWLLDYYEQERSVSDGLRSANIGSHIAYQICKVITVLRRNPILIIKSLYNLKFYLKYFKNLLTFKNFSKNILFID